MKLISIIILIGIIAILSSTLVSSLEWETNPKSGKRVSGLKKSGQYEHVVAAPKKPNDDDSDTSTTTTTTTTTTKPPTTTTTTTTTTTQNYECDTSDDCEEINCMISYCGIHHMCMYMDEVCVVPEDNMCIGTTGCNDNNGFCQYFERQCNDNNVCTRDYCIRSPSNSSDVQCVFEPIPNCDSTCTHHVNITIDDIAELNITTYSNGSLISVCHTSTYFGENYAVVLGFDPYVLCRMNERGTCDNFPGYHYNDITESYCGESTDAGYYPCTFSPEIKGITMPGYSTTLLWSTFPSPPVLSEDIDTGSAHLHGYLYDSSNPDVSLIADIWFYGRTDIPPPGYPKQEMYEGCYDTIVNTTSWHYYTTLSGGISGVVSSPYNGLHFIVSSASGEYTQIGEGANNRNANMGIGAGFNWMIVHQPIDEEYYVDAQQTHCADLAMDLYTDGDCHLTNNTGDIQYCDYFDEYVYTPVNGWHASHSSIDNTVTYCRNFTLEELISCHNFSDIHGGLFSVINSVSCQNDTINCAITYYGTLYETTVYTPSCELECNETITSSACYNISISIDASGTSEISYYADGSGFDLQWMGNIWLCGEDKGNLKVKLRTYINQRSGDELVYLCNPRIHHETETGYPIDFDPSLPLPPCTYPHCTQDWVLRTFDAYGVEDFSGVKTIEWDICTNGEPFDNVIATINLHAKHVGEQTHIEDGAVEAALSLYNERSFSLPYTGTTMIDCDNLYGLLCLTNHAHLDVIIKEAYICFSAERNLIPYDPLHPGTTGCNTPGSDVRILQIYDFYNDIETIHMFELLFNPPDTAACEGFVFRVKAYTQYAQILRIQWCAQENGGNGGLIGLISEIQHGDGRVTQRHSEHDEEDHSFTVACPHSWYYDWGLYECRHHDHWDNDDWWINAIVISVIILGLLIAFCCLVPWFSGPVAVPVPVKPQPVHVHHHHNNTTNIDTTVVSSSNSIVNMPTQRRNIQLLD